MGEILSKDMLADLIINIINILILFFVSKALLYKPVKKYLDQRRENQANAVEEAERRKAEAEAEKQKYTGLMADTAAIRTGAMREATEKANAKAEQILAAANAEAEEILKNSRAAAKRESDKLIADSKEQLGALAVELSGKILAREVTDADNIRIINSFFGE